MNRTLILILCLVLPTSIARAEPFAPTVEGKTSPLYRAVLSKLRKEMPDAKTVGVPRCPDCVAMQMAPGLNGGLPSIYLLSKQPVDDVVAFYATRLTKWKKSKDFGDQWVFRKGVNDEKNPLAPTVPQVVVYTANPEMLPDPIFEGYRTLITVYYRPTEAQEKRKGR